MKKSIIFIVFILVLSINLNAVTYYISSSRGDDANNGLSAKTPWKTLDKINKSKFQPGDFILFQRGDIWRGQLRPNSGNESGYITYSAYGKKKAAKPRLLGSISWDNQADWKNISGNIWITDASAKTLNSPYYRRFSEDVGNIIFNGGEVCGVKVWNDASLDAQGKFLFERDKKVLKLYSVGNPASFYKSIELAQKGHIVDQGNKNYVKYEDLDIRYGAAHGFGGGSVHHIVILNCDISFIGGAWQQSRPNGDPVRYGNGIEFWDNAHDCYVIGCKISDIYDAALTNQGQANKAQYNIYYWNNIIWNSEYSFEYWLGENSKTSHIYFENNTCALAGNGWGHNQRPDGRNGRHMMFYRNLSNLDNFYIRNNIFCEATESAIRFGGKFNNLDNVSMEHNIYYGKSGKLAMWLGTSYSLEEFEKFQKDTGKETTSIFTDPQFVEMSKYNFNLKPKSPAINKGMDINSPEYSMFKTQKIKSQFDIGAVESPY